MDDCEMEVRLIAKEISKRYIEYNYDYIYNVSFYLFGCGIRVYMFFDGNDKLGIWEIVHYVLINFNVVNIRDISLKYKIKDNNLCCCEDNSIIEFKSKKRLANVSNFFKRM